jgi:DNA-binding transcriptional regulator/RsmH inhibitor MraZ
LEKEVVFAGQVNKFEIWSKDCWEEEFKRVKENIESMGETLARLGL